MLNRREKKFATFLVNKVYNKISQKINYINEGLWSKEKTAIVERLAKCTLWTCNRLVLWLSGE